MADETDELQAVLGVEFQGIDDALRYADAMKSVAQAEGRVARATKARQEAQQQGAGSLPTIQQALAALDGVPARSGPASASSGPNARLAAIQAEIAKIRPGVTSPDIVEDLFHRRGQAQKAVERMRGGGPSAMETALRSTRFGAGPLSPLAGRTLDAVIGPAASKAAFGVAAKLAGPIGIALAALDVVKTTGEELFKLSQASAAATNALTSIQAQAGGSMLDAARLSGMGFLGASAQGAQAFKDRITSDPMAMSAAGRFGIHNLKGAFGDQNLAAQYMKAIEETSKIEDESLRRRIATQLGIQEEVTRYSLLSENTKGAMRATAFVSSKVNDPEQQKAAAEFAAAVANESKARENLTGAIGQLFEKDFTAFLNMMAFVENAIALSIKQTSGFLKFFLKNNPLNPLGMMFGHMEETADALGLGTKSGSGGALTQNTRSNIRLTDSIDRLNGTVQGAGQRGGGFLGNVRDAGGAGLHEAVMTRSLAFGALG